MSETFISTPPPKRRGPSGRRRWTATDKAHYLAAFAKSGLSTKVFCAEMNVPRSSFTLWQQEARRAVPTNAAPTARAKPSSFARVEVVAPAPPNGITLVLRSVHGDVAELAGLDTVTALTLVRSLLARGRR